MLTTALVHSVLQLRSCRQKRVAKATTVKQLRLAVLETAQTSDGLAERLGISPFNGDTRRTAGGTAAEGQCKFAEKKKCNLWQDLNPGNAFNNAAMCRLRRADNGLWQLLQ